MAKGSKHDNTDVYLSTTTGTAFALRRKQARKSKLKTSDSVTPTAATNALMADYLNQAGRTGRLARIKAGRKPKKTETE